MRKNIFKTPKKSNIEAIQRICGVQMQEKVRKRKRSRKKLLVNKRLKQQNEQLNNLNREQECLHQKISRIHDRYDILDNQQQTIKQDQKQIKQDHKMIRKRQDKIKQDQQMIKQEQEEIAREIAELKSELLKQSKSARCFQIQDNQQEIYQDSPKIKKNTDTKSEVARKKHGFFPDREKDKTKFIDKKASANSNDEDITTPKLN